MNLTMLLAPWSNSFDYGIAESFAWFYKALPHKIQEFICAYSALGNVGIFLILAGILLLIFKKTRKIGGICLVSVLLTLVVNDSIFKNIFQRLRPCYDPLLAGNLPTDFIIPGLAPSATSKSFPSGHTFQFFATLSGIMMLYIFDKEDRKYNLWFLILFAIMAPLMGISRILLTHHWATDVITGALLGFASGIGGYYIVKYVPVLFNLIVSKIKNNKKVATESASEDKNEEK